MNATASNTALELSGLENRQAIITNSEVATPANDYRVLARNATVNEGDGVIEVEIRGRGVLQEAIEVAYTLQTSSARPSYEALGATVTFEPGTAQNVSVQIQINDDDIPGTGGTV